MIVAAEFGMWQDGAVYPELFHLRSAAELAWTFPAYTFGEAATATVLSSDDAAEWEFHFRSRAELADLCTVPLDGFERYAWPGERMVATACAGLLRTAPRCSRRRCVSWRSCKASSGHRWTRCGW